MTFNSYSLAGEDPNPMTVEEVQCLKRLIKENMGKSPVIINIGAGIGVSGSISTIRESMALGSGDWSWNICPSRRSPASISIVT